MKTYEIWIGNYYCSEGYHPPPEPAMVGRVLAIDFKTACMKYELEKTLTAIRDQEKRGHVDARLYKWFFDDENLLHGVLGPYYESKEKAAVSFNTNS